MYEATLSNVNYSYSDHHVLRDITFTAEAGDFVCLLGPSGCGKSTLLRLLAGLSFPSSGGITLDGKPISGPGLDRGVVFQDYSLFPWMTTTLKDRQADFEHFLTALLKAYRYYLTDRNGTVDVVAKYVQIGKADLLTDIYGGHLLVSPDPHRKSVLQFWDFMKKAEYVTSNEAIDNRINTRLYASALSTLQKREPQEKLWKTLEKEFKSGDPELHIHSH